jgi:hypothetical protein
VALFTIEGRCWRGQMNGKTGTPLMDYRVTLIKTAGYAVMSA